MLDNYKVLLNLIQKGDIRSAKIIAFNGIHIHNKDNNGFTAIHIAVMNGHKRCLEILLESGRIDVNAKDNYGRTALYCAAIYGRTECVNTLLASPEIDANAGRTVLQWAVENRKYRCVETLLQSKKINVNDECLDSRTLLHRAVIKGSCSVVSVLLANGANVNARDINNWTPLHFAAFSGNKKIVKILLANKADVNAKDTKGRTALHRAVISKDKYTIKLLLVKGADTTIQNQYGRTPIEYAYSDEIKDLFKSDKTNATQSNDEVKEVFDKEESRYELRGYANVVLMPIIPAAFLLAVSSNPIHHVILSNVALLSSYFLGEVNASKANHSAYFSASTALYCLAPRLSKDHVIPCKAVAALIAMGTMYSAASQYRSNSAAASQVSPWF